MGLRNFKGEFELAPLQWHSEFSVSAINIEFSET